MYKSLYICDACKKEANQKWLGVLPDDWFTVLKQAKANSLYGIRTEIRHFCSVRCLEKWSLKDVSPATVRPNEAPMFIDAYCKCGEKLILLDLVEHPDLSIEERWNDEFFCPKCNNGIYIDEPTNKHEFRIDGCIETHHSLDNWSDAFLEWLESRSETFGGGIRQSNEK